LRYQQALRLSAAAQAIYAANHSDSGPRHAISQTHEQAFNQLVELQKQLDGPNVNILV